MSNKQTNKQEGRKKGGVVGRSRRREEGISDSSRVT